MLFETNNNGPYRWHVRITQIDCVRNTYNARNTLAGRQKMHGYAYNDHGLRMRRHAQPADRDDQSIGLPNKLDSVDRRNRSQNENDAAEVKRTKRFVLMTEAALRVTPPAPQGCLQFYSGR